MSVFQNLSTAIIPTAFWVDQYANKIREHGAGYLDAILHLSHDADVNVHDAIQKGLREMHDSSHHYEYPISEKISHLGVGFRADYHMPDMTVVLSADDEQGGFSRVWFELAAEKDDNVCVHPVRGVSDMAVNG